MIQNEKVNDLFQEITGKSKIRHFVSNGFDKYVIYNDSGSFFSVGFNKTIKKYGLGRTELMLQEYKKRNLLIETMPDIPVVYNFVVQRYDIYKSMSREFNFLFDLINRFTGKDGPKR